MASDIFGTFRSTVEDIAWPRLVAGTAALLEAYLARLERSQWLGPEAIAAAQRRQLELLARHSARHSVGFAARLAAAGLEPADIAVPGGLQRLPSLTRREVQRGGEMFCNEDSEDHRPVGANRTSGSTGEPVEVRRTALNQLGWMAMWSNAR